MRCNGMEEGWCYRDRIYLALAMLFLSGQDPAAIVMELRSVKSSDGGRRYQKALAEVLDLIREGLRA